MKQNAEVSLKIHSACSDDPTSGYTRFHQEELKAHKTPSNLLRMKPFKGSSSSSGNDK